MWHDAQMSDPAQDEARRLVAARELVGAASAHLTSTIASHLPFEGLVAYKTLLKRYFSAAPWDEDDDHKLDKLVRPHLSAGWWDEPLAPDLVLSHGIRDGIYVMEMHGAGEPSGTGLFDRVFEGPVIPEPTPHPRKVKFTVGGIPAPGVWWRRGDEVDDEAAARLLTEPDITDIMVAGDFVTVGLDRAASWEDRLDDLLALVTELFWKEAASPPTAPPRSRDQLVAEGRGLAATAEELHLLDPDRPPHRDRLQAALASADARVRRMAVAVLAGSADEAVAMSVLRQGVADEARIVRRVAVDAAADADHPAVTALLTELLGDEDSWIRWKAARALADRGHTEDLAALTDDPDFQVRFEAERAQRSPD